MKKQLFALFLGGFWMASCQNDAVPGSQAAAQPAPVIENPAPVAEPIAGIPEVKTQVGQPAVPQNIDPKPGGQNQPPATQNPAAAAQNQSPAPAQNQVATNQPTPSGNPARPLPAPRTALPDDAMCFVARETDGRVFEIRLAMVDAKKVMGDLLISNVQTGEFVQGRLNGERREMVQFLLSWSFTGDDRIRHITNVSYLLSGNKLIQKSRDAEDEGRVFQKIDCGKMK